MNESLPSWRELLAQRVRSVDACDLGWRRRWLGYPQYWRWQIGGWLLVMLSHKSLLFIMPARHRWREEILITSAFFCSCVVFTHLLRGIIIGLRARGLTWKGLVARMLPWMLVFAALWGAGIAWLGSFVVRDAFRLGPYGPEMMMLSPAQRFTYDVLGIANGALVMQTVWAVCYFLHHLFCAYQHSQMERLRLEASGREAEVRHLRRQMDPHFLFNSLNTVRALIAPENAEARGALTHLSELLRNSLRQNDKALIPLMDELSALDSHLAIEQLRFGPRLRVRMRVEEGLGAWLVPPFLIQTLVENAIKHGIARLEEGGSITLSICMSRACLFCIVRNPGVLKHGGNSGHGLRNISTRLDHLYQGAASFLLQQSARD